MSVVILEFDKGFLFGGDLEKFTVRVREVKGVIV